MVAAMTIFAATGQSGVGLGDGRCYDRRPTVLAPMHGGAVIGDRHDDVLRDGDATTHGDATTMMMEVAFGDNSNTAAPSGASEIHAVAMANTRDAETCGGESGWLE